MSFQQHLKDAIEINKQRALYYKEQTNGRSVTISRALIVLEYLALPIAIYFEKQAKPFNQQGIMLVKHDFVPMQVADKTRQPPFQNALNVNALKYLQKNQKKLMRNINVAIKSQEGLMDLYECAKAHLAILEAFEEQHEIHLSMTKHLLESYLFIAKNGLRYAEQSENKTLKLSQRLLSLHQRLFTHTLKFDKAANHCHQMGVGILYNDLPDMRHLLNR